jgi:hypothetical protein
MTISLDRKPAESRDFLVVLISTLHRLFLGLRPYWGTEAGAIQYTAVSAQPKYLLRALPFLWSGRKSRYLKTEHGYFSHNVDEARLKFDDGFTLDGELYRPDADQGPVVVQDGGPVSFLRI